MCPAGEGTEQWKCEGEVEEEFERGRDAILMLRDDPIGDQQECRREVDQIVHGQVWCEQNGCEQ